jgi:hypothetical protein
MPHSSDPPTTWAPSQKSKLALLGAWRYNNDTRNTLRCSSIQGNGQTGANEHDKGSVTALILSILIKRPTTAPHFRADIVFNLAL